MEKDEKKCWKCGRILVRKSKTGLCPKCVEQIEAGAAGAAALGSFAVVILKKVGKEGIKHIFKL